MRVTTARRKTDPVQPTGVGMMKRILLSALLLSVLLALGGCEAGREPETRGSGRGYTLADLAGTWLMTTETGRSYRVRISKSGRMIEHSPAGRTAGQCGPATYLGVFSVRPEGIAEAEGRYMCAGWSDNYFLARRYLLDFESAGQISGKYVNLKTWLAGKGWLPFAATEYGLAMKKMQ